MIARAHSMWCLIPPPCKTYAKDTLPDLYSFSLLVTLGRFAVARQGLIIKEVKDSMLKSNEVHLAKEEARANHELTAIERSMEELSVSIRDEVNEESKRDLGQLLEEMQEQKAANEVFRKTCEEALLESKNIHDGIEQEIKKTEADNNSRAVVGLINTDGEVRNIKQNISETSAKGGSFAGAGIIRGLDLTIPGSRNR